MSCQPFRIIVENYLESASMAITPPPFETMPLSNVLVADRAAVLMTQSRREHVIVGNFDRRRVVNAFAVINHTLSIYGTVRLELFYQDDQQGLAYDSGAVRARRRIPLQSLAIGVDPWGATHGMDLMSSAPLWFDSVLVRSFRITVYDKAVEGQPDHWSIGYLSLGRYWSPAKNFNWTSSIQWVQSVNHSRSEGKTLHSEGTFEQYRVMSFQLDWLDDEDANQLYAFIREFGGLKEFFISMYPGSKLQIREIEHNMLARFVTELPARIHNSPGWYSTAIEVEEI